MSFYCWFLLDCAGDKLYGAVGVYDGVSTPVSTLRGEISEGRGFGLFDGVESMW